MRLHHVRIIFPECDRIAGIQIDAITYLNDDRVIEDAIVVSEATEY
jgi:hypothetical protein